MGKLLIVLLFSFIVSFAWGLLGVNMFGSTINSADKLIRLSLIYLVVVTLLLTKNFKIRSNIYSYLIPAIIFISILTLHYLISGISLEFESLKARKELLRLSSFIVVLVSFSGVTLKLVDYKLLIKMIGIFGLPLGILTIRHSFVGDTEIRTKQVEDLIRAGSELVSTNSLGAALCLTTLFAICAFMLTKNKIHKLIYLFIIVITQVGRLFTFSNGSLLNISVAILSTVLLLKMYHKIMYKKLLNLIALMLVILSIAIIATGGTERIFSRVFKTGDTGLPISIESRISQYSGAFQLFINEPLRVFYGTGAAKAPSLLGTNLVFHNAYLRPLIETGILGFLSFMYLWWQSLKNYILAIKYNKKEDERSIITIILFSTFLGFSFQILTVPYSTSSILWFFVILSYTIKNSNYMVKNGEDIKSKKDLSEYKFNEN